MKMNSEKLQLLRTVFQGIIALGVVIMVFREIGFTKGRIGLLLYIISVAFQLSGAVILLIGTFGKSSDHIVNEVLRRVTFLKISTESSVINGATESVYLSRTAFVYLAAGYALNVFGRQGIGNSWVILMSVLLVSSGLVAVPCLAVKRQAGQMEDELKIEDSQPSDSI